MRVLLASCEPGRSFSNTTCSRRIEARLAHHSRRSHIHPSSFSSSFSSLVQGLSWLRPLLSLLPPRARAWAPVRYMVRTHPCPHEAGAQGVGWTPFGCYSPAKVSGSPCLCDRRKGSETKAFTKTSRLQDNVTTSGLSNRLGSVGSVVGRDDHLECTAVLELFSCEDEALL